MIYLEKARRLTLSMLRRKGRSALTVQLEGWTDRFDFDPSNCPAARYAREGGAHYEF